jgi:protocatechuate 3,4-dioxygenase beta subunit
MRKTISSCDLSGVSKMKSVFNIILLITLSLFFSQPSSAARTECLPTAPDAEGPFYKGEAPIRANTGRGLTVSGKVRSAASCAVIPGARVEWWQTNPQGRYDDEHRGAQLTSSDGGYRFETDFPPGYFGRAPHIHFKVFAPGHRSINTQIYPKSGQSTITFDFVLINKRCQILISD